METITKTTARKAFERAKATGKAADWQAAADALWAYINKPKARRGRWPGVFPAPAMQTTFADQRRVRMTVYQLKGKPLPVERAIAGARSLYRSALGREAPPVLSCEKVTGPRRGEYIAHPFKPNGRTLAILGQYEHGVRWRDNGSDTGGSRLNGNDYASAAFDPWRQQARDLHKEAA